MAKQAKSGICALTGTFGAYVDSHIIPLALTRLSRTGEKHVEAGIGLGVKTRANSWYDGTLVTRSGEDILARIDSAAIDELRKLSLVWSGWGPERTLQTDDVVSEKGHAAYRVVPIAEPRVLQLFFLSLLWRAAASTRPEFKEISLAAAALEDLKHRVSSEDPGRAEDFPIQLFQIITRGPPHNRTPLLERKTVLRMDGSTDSETEYVRFYFDGLVAHVHLANGHDFDEDYLSTCLGFQRETIVFLHEFERSRTAADIKEMVLTVERERTTIETPLSAVVKSIRTQWPRR